MGGFVGASGASTEVESVLALILGMSLDKFTLLRWRSVYNGRKCVSGLPVPGDALFLAPGDVPHEGVIGGWKWGIMFAEGSADVVTVFEQSVLQHRAVPANPTFI
jgi:hypothetical protein